ncbi:MAG: P-II family nitrogen regulator [Anaerolineae bacterium]|jgi:nitrogen regulatory protein P-II 1
MKKVEAVIKSAKFSAVREALAKAGFSSLTTYEVKGRGRQSAVGTTPDGITLYAGLLKKVKIEVVTQAENVEKVIEIIVEAARTGEIGDGKIFVSDIEDVLRIRTGERGNDAI